MSDQVMLGVVVLAIVAGALAGAWFYMHQRRRVLLRQQFGPEYDHIVRTTGAPAKAEAILEERARRVEQFAITPLSPEGRGRFTDEWRRVQALFVDDPRAAVTEADRLIADVMRARGYPVEDDFNRRAADLSVHHARVVEHYRAGRDIALRHERGAASTEDLRQAMVHFRALFEELVTSSVANDPGHTRRRAS